MPRLPIGAVGDRAGVDNVAIRRFFERDKRMILFKATLDDCRIILIDFATESCNGYAHLRFAILDFGFSILKTRPRILKPSNLARSILRLRADRHDKRPLPVPVLPPEK